MVNKLRNRLASDLLERILGFVGNDKHPGVNAMECFDMVGAGAGPAIPDLVRIMEDPGSTRNLRLMAIHSLHSIGKDAVPPLLAALTNQAQLDRVYVAFDLSEMRDLGTNTTPVIRVLVQNLGNKDRIVAQITAYALGQMRARVTAADLRGLLDDRDAAVRSYATNVFREISQEKTESGK